MAKKNRYLALFLIFCANISYGETKGVSKRVKANHLKNEIGFSFGLNYLIMTHEFTNLNVGKLKYESFNLNNYSFDSKYNLSESRYIKAKYKTEDIYIKSNELLIVEKKRAHLNNIYLGFSNKLSDESQPLYLDLAFEQKSILTIERTGANTINALSYRSNLFSFGLTKVISDYLGPWSYEAGINFKHPLSTLDSYQLKPIVLIELSSTAKYKISEYWTTEINWSLEIQNYKTESPNLDPVSNTNNQSETQNVNSQIYFKLNYLF